VLCVLCEAKIRALLEAKKQTSSSNDVIIEGVIRAVMPCSLRVGFELFTL
jgi:hypothetical protein